MKDVLRVVGNILLYVFVILVFLWTASLTLTLVRRVLPNDDITPYFALALFDGGALTWLVVFIARAEGLVQRGISLLMVVFDLIGVVLMSGAEIFLGGQSFAAIPANLGMIVVWAVGIWTAINLVAIYGFHIADPGVQEAIELRTQQDLVQSEALAQARHRLEEKSAELGKRLADRIYQRALYNLRLLDDGSGGSVIDGELKEPGEAAGSAGNGGAAVGSTVVYAAETAAADPTRPPA